MKKVFENNGIETEIFNLGNKPISGCIGCGKCLNSGKCFIKVKDADGFVFGSPVHFASCSGALTSFMDRVFYGRERLFANKPACGIVSCRRGGAVRCI